MPPTAHLPVGVTIAHGVVARVLLVLFRYLEAHFLDAPVVSPVHFALLANQRGGGGLLGQGRVTGSSGGGLSDGGQQPTGDKGLEGENTDL